MDNKTTKMIKKAKQIRKTTKKMVDDVFLKLVGMRVLERAKAMTEILQKEKKTQKAETAKKTLKKVAAKPAKKKATKKVSKKATK